MQLVISDETAGTDHVGKSAPILMSAQRKIAARILRDF